MNEYPPPPDGSRPPPNGSGPPPDGSRPPPDRSRPPPHGSGPPPHGSKAISYEHVQAGLKICREEGIDCDGAVEPADQCRRPKPPRGGGGALLDLDDPVFYFNMGCRCCEKGEELATTQAPQDEVVFADMNRHAFGHGGVLTAKEVVCQDFTECEGFFSTINQDCSAKQDSFKEFFDDLIAKEDEFRGNQACHCCQVHDSKNIFGEKEECDFEKLDCPQILLQFNCSRRDFLGLEPVFGFGFGKNATIDADRLVCGCCFAKSPGGGKATLEAIALQLEKDSAAPFSSTNPLAVLGSVMIFLKFILH
jgi:hypothetical protein